MQFNNNSTVLQKLKIQCAVYKKQKGNHKFAFGMTFSFYVYD